MKESSGDPMNGSKLVSFPTAGEEVKKPQPRQVTRMLDPSSRTVSMAKCDTRCHVIARIPTRKELKTLTHLAKRPAINIDFRDISYTVRNPFDANDKQILRNVSGSFRTGELTAILGSSGAGKSTLMNILAGYVTIGVNGTIETNGHPRQLKLFNKLTSYIMQDDLLQPFLTVEESMHIAAYLKLGDELKQTEKRQVVDEILTTLGLNKAKDTRTERLSGGQRKRLSVALELVSNPPVIFLDEPTTGLDLVSTSQLMSHLKMLARQGRTIICTIHQPSATVFNTLDLVYVMSSGECLYQGPHDQLVPYLSRSGFHCPTTYNPADFVMELISTEEREYCPVLYEACQNGKTRIENQQDNQVAKNGERITKLCRKETVAIMPKVFSSDIHDTGSSLDMVFPTNVWQQTYILLKRKLIQQTRNKTTLWIMFMHHVLSGALVGCIFDGVGDDANKPFENFKFIMSCVVFFMYTHVFVNILLFPFEVERLRREYFNRWYGLKSYFLAHTISTIPQQLVFGLIFIVITYFWSGQPVEAGRIAWFYVTGFLLGLVSEGIGLTIATIFKVMDGCVAGPAVVVPMLALAVYGMGYGPAIEPVMKVLMTMSYLRFGINGFSTAILADRGEIRCDPNAMQYCHYKDPNILLRDLGMTGLHPPAQALVLLVFFLLYRITAYLALRFKLSVQFSTQISTYISKVLRQR